ncbi:hypothetical protein chiPu_0030281, partial [Chiloscyllium punctatum]|nr:hypothetical protein [Chiloscyllium punctatum]
MGETEVSRNADWEKRTEKLRNTPPWEHECVPEESREGHGHLNLRQMSPELFADGTP